MRLGREISLEEVEDALNRSQAAAFVAEKGGPGSEVNAHGSNFSGGQQQRLLLARALAGSPEILLLDDATSALDFKTEAAFRKALREKSGDTTTIIIAQRISAVMHCDRILVMEDGAMLGLGIHEELMKNWEEIDTENGKYRVGIGMAVGAHGCGCFGAHRDQICVMIKMNEDGTCVYYTGSHDMGNGSVTAQLQVVSNVLKMPLEAITCVEADTDAVPWNLGDYSSHGVFVGCSAAKKTAETTAQDLLKEAALLMDEPVENLELVEMGVHSRVSDKTVSLCDVVVHAQAVSHREIICQESHVMSNGPTAYGAHFARVKVNMENGNVQVTDYVAVHDVGKVINRMGIEGQLEGAIPMGIGYALFEGLHINESGVNDVNNLVKYHIPHINEMPKMQVDFIEAGEPGGPFGAKSIGEASVVPAAPAVMNAVVNALNVEINDLPYRWGGGVKSRDYYLEAK